MALSKFLVQLAPFLSESHANAFTCLSLVAGNQVQVNHLIQFQQPMSNPTNKPSCKPNGKSIKQMDLDAELPNNLLPQKTLLAYSEPKQDAELPSKNTVSTNTQTCGLCHNRKSEPESLVEQPIAATDSSQNMLPASLGLRLATPTLLAALDPSASFTLPTALDLFASSITPAALDLSANTLLSATLDLRSGRQSNLSADLGLGSASTTNLSAALDLHSASCLNSNKMCSASQLAANEHKGFFNCKTASSFKLIVESSSEGAQPAPTLLFEKPRGHGLIVD